MATAATKIQSRNKTEPRLPRDIHPQLAAAAKSPPLGDDWLHEIKFDGYRILAFKEGNSVRLLSRNDQQWTRQFQSVAKALHDLPGDAVLDGEVVVLDEHGRSSFQALQRRVKGQKSGELVYFVFDLLWLNGQDLRGVTLVDRKEALRQLLENLPDKYIIRFSDYVIGTGDLFYKGICELGVEGMVSKKVQSRYVGRRSRDWVKVKCPKQQDFVVGGFTAPDGSRIGFGSLLVGCYDQHGDLHYAGSVGTGFDHFLLRELHPLLLELEIPDSPFVDPPSRKEIRTPTWVEPLVAVDVAFTEWTDDGRLRHPIFKGLRCDKEVQQVRKEAPGSFAPDF